MERLPPGIEFIILPTGIDFTLPGQRAPWDEQADIATMASGAIPFNPDVNWLALEAASKAQQDGMKRTNNDILGAVGGWPFGRT